MSNKYNAKPVYFSHRLGRQLSIDEVESYSFKLTQLRKSNKFGTVIRFDSKLEFKVYQALFSNPSVSTVIPHCEIELIPKNSSRVFPNGKTWKVDFLVKGQHKEPLFLIEAKGIIQRDFAFILNLLEQNQPQLFNKLWLVFSDKVPTSKLLVRNLKKNKFPRLVTLREFEQQFR